MAAIAAVVIVAALVWKLEIPWVPAWLLAMGVVTFGMYAWDKGRARARGGRVPETVLMALVLVGGVAGGWAGMLLLRRKTRHTSFWVVQWVATLLWAAVALWLVVG